MCNYEVQEKEKLYLPREEIILLWQSSGSNGDPSTYIFWCTCHMNGSLVSQQACHHHSWELILQLSG